MSSGERGAVLLEVLAGLAILAAVAAGVLPLVSQGLDAVERATARQALLRVEERVLTAHVLLTHADLDRRLGRRQIGEVFVEVRRPTATLYRLSVGLADSEREDLVTVVRRWEGPRGP